MEEVPSTRCTVAQKGEITQKWVWLFKIVGTAWKETGMNWGHTTQPTNTNLTPLTLFFPKKIGHFLVVACQSVPDALLSICICILDHFSTPYNL